MARGREQHQAHKAAVAGLGRDISRRARSCCELCADSGRLDVIEVEPVEADPSIDRALLVCGRCQVLMLDGFKHQDPSTLRFLTESAWSEVLPAQLTAVRLLRAVAGEGVDWALEANENIWLPEDVAALV